MSPIGKRPMFRVQAEVEVESDEVRLYYEEGGRHFGEKVEESIIEK